MRPDAEGMDKHIDSPTSGSKRVWKDLDGVKVDFRSSHRPRARYLYFLYCTSMSRKSWHDQERDQALTDELGKLHWGTPGRYLHRNMILAFVEEMGHEYERLLEGAIKGDISDEIPDEVALVAAINQIDLSHRQKY